MSDEIRIEFRRALWTLVVGAFLAIAGTIASNIITTATLKERIISNENELETLRVKVDLIQVQLERKVNRQTMDVCLHDMDLKLDKMQSGINSSLSEINKNIIEIYKKLPK